MTINDSIPSAEEIQEWQEHVYDGDPMVEMRKEHFDRLMFAAKLLLYIRDASRACYVDYDGCELTKDTWVYIIKGVDPRTAHDFVADVRKTMPPICP